MPLSLRGDQYALEDIVDEAGPVAVPRISSVLRGPRLVKPVEPASSPVDLLSSIMAGQNLLHLPGSDVKIHRDGTLSAIKSPPPENASCDVTRSPSGCSAILKNMDNGRTNSRGNTFRVKETPLNGENGTSEAAVGKDHGAVEGDVQDPPSNRTAGDGGGANEVSHDLAPDNGAEFNNYERGEGHGDGVSADSTHLLNGDTRSRRRDRGKDRKRRDSGERSEEGETGEEDNDTEEEEGEERVGSSTSDQRIPEPSDERDQLETFKFCGDTRSRNYRQGNSRNRSHGKGRSHSRRSSVSQPGRDSDHEEGLVQEDEGAISTDGERDEDEEGTVEEEGVKSKVYSTAKEAEKVAIDEGEDHEQTERDLLQSPPEKSRRSERDGEEKPTEKISEKRKHSEDSEEEGEDKTVSLHSKEELEGETNDGERESGEEKKSKDSGKHVDLRQVIRIKRDSPTRERSSSSRFGDDFSDEDLESDERLIRNEREWDQLRYYEERYPDFDYEAFHEHWNSMDYYEREMYWENFRITRERGLNTTTGSTSRTSQSGPPGR
ncbi:hypothetical protein BSL78_14449 [Apostichopus japonicus]|uniref:Uncharacterized protein n=1 Tax=Stichopus japonicus TaxID=307972 RepID=A0A2G8KL34_STIJA|nr:hypothetical protein BSL78_14449 [Apostichopus japonicus]